MDTPIAGSMGSGRPPSPLTHWRALELCRQVGQRIVWTNCIVRCRRTTQANNKRVGAVQDFRTAQGRWRQVKDDLNHERPRSGLGVGWRHIGRPEAGESRPFALWAWPDRVAEWLADSAGCPCILALELILGGSARAHTHMHKHKKNQSNKRTSKRAPTENG